MVKIDIKQLLSESLDENIITESYNGIKISHLYEDYTMTFGEMKNIFQEIFCGKTILTEKVDGQNIMVTFKDGQLGFARNKRTMQEPMNIDKLRLFFEGNPKVKDAFINSANDIIKAFNSIDSYELNKLFDNGKNFANLVIVYPPVKNMMDYGNRCILQLNGIDRYDQNFNKLGTDDESSKWLYENLKSNKALKQEMFEIEEPRILRMKNSVSGEKALKQILEDFNKVIDGYSTKCTIQDYANERLRRYLINICNYNNIEVERDCTFIKELADRIGNFSGRRPTKSDICTFAKRAGVNVHGEDYKKLIETVDTQREQINEEIMRPIENLVMKAGILLFKNLTGFMSADPQKTSRKLVEDLEHAIYEVEQDNSKLTMNKLKIFKKNFKKINEWQEKYIPSAGCIFKINGKVYKVTGSFGPCSKILGIFKY